jgi:peptide/nickel transport system permease protein
LYPFIIFFLVLVFLGLSIKVKPTHALGKLVSLLAVLLGATLVVTSSMRLIPGDVVDHILGDQAQATSKTRLAMDLGLINQNGEKTTFIEQYAQFLQSLVKMDVKTFITRKNAVMLVRERLGYTIALALSAMLIAAMIGPFFGVLADGLIKFLAYWLYWAYLCQVFF